MFNQNKLILIATSILVAKIQLLFVKNKFAFSILNASYKITKFISILKSINC